MATVMPTERGEAGGEEGRCAVSLVWLLFCGESVLACPVCVELFGMGALGMMMTAGDSSVSTGFPGCHVRQSYSYPRFSSFY